jgi:amino-acid N-acetyltransferase
MPASFEVRERPELSAAARVLESAGLPASDLTTEMLLDFFCIGPCDGPTGLVGVEVLGEHALLRSLIVVPGFRLRGAGKALVETAERHARSRGVRELYLLTTSAEEFFARRGYARIARSEAPEAVRTTREFSDICPANSVFMRKILA